VLRCFVMVSCSVRALFYGVAAALLTGCASGSGTPPPNEQAVAALAPAPALPRVTLNDVKSTQDAQAQEIARLGAELKAQDAQQSFLVAELKSLSEQVTKLKASLDEAEGAVRALRATPVAPETRPAAPPAPPPGSAPAIVTSPPPPTVSAPSAPVTSPSPPTVSAPPAPVSPGPRNVEAERMFAAALTQLRSGNDGQAALQFTEFVTQYPSHPQAAAAQNYIGEAFYRQRDFRQAVAEFQKTVDNYTQATPVSEALLKIGLCQRALGDAAAAKAAWEQVIKQFPKTDAARQARTLLAAKPGGPR
jgi:tol-pal system protein YbgF